MANAVTFSAGQHQIRTDKLELQSHACNDIIKSYFVESDQLLVVKIRGNVIAELRRNTESDPKIQIVHFIQLYRQWC